MKKKLLPQWLIDMIIVLYRLMCGGFGKKVPKPYYGNFCGPFWAVFFTYIVPVLTSFVFMAVVVRILLGEKRGEIMGSAVVASGSWMVATKTRAAISSAIFLGLLAIPIVLFWSLVWLPLAIVGGYAVLALAAVIVWELSDEGNLDFIYSFFSSFFGKVRDFWDALPKPVRWPLIGIAGVVCSPGILALALIVGLAYGIVFAYENYCPLVRESYSSS